MNSTILCSAFSRFYLFKNSMKCLGLNKHKFSKYKKMFVKEICTDCLNKSSVCSGRYFTTLYPTTAYKYFGTYNQVRLQSSQLKFDEHKLEQFLKNLNWNQLESNYNFNIIHEKILLNLLKEKEKLEESVKELESMKENEESKKNNKEMMELIEGDLAQYNTELTEIYEKIIDIILPREDFEDCNDILLEITAGVGGSEAQLFAGELFNMYIGFLENKGWEYHVAENDKSELGGVRHCSILVTGPGAYSTLQHEAGVHRVQRVPETEKGGRMHTSTVTVAVLPQPSEVEVKVKESDLKIETKRASGAGGQHVNTTDSAVRITHLPSGIIVECQSDRSQGKNRETALKKLRTKLYEMEINKVNAEQRSQRKSQIGTSARSEKIRTYNFRDDRVSDHRLTVNLHNMKDFLQGGEQFEKLLEQLIRWHHEHQIKKFIDSLP